MKSVHVPFGFYPDPAGGTEVYVTALATALTRQGHPAIIAAPGTADAEYTHDELPVHRFAVSDDVGDVAEIYGDGDANAAARFGRILERERPDVLHLHAFTRACSVKLVREARSRRIPVVFTYHTPTVSCQRGTLLEFGRQPCDGSVRVSRCASCTLHGLGMNESVSRLLGRTPVAVGHLLEAARLGGGGWTALRMSSLTDRRRQAFLALLSLADRIVALSPWVHAVLKQNGVPDSKIFVSPHGISESDARPFRRSANRSRRVRVAHLGRLDPVKGTGLLIRALRLIPEAPIDLDIFGIVQGSADLAVLGELRGLAADDPRIRFLPAIEHSTVVDRLADYDLTAVPSQWLETGPLVVLESFAAGTPVVGSALGGLLDKVTDGVDGLLVRPHDSVHAWARLLMRCAEEREWLARLRSAVRLPRVMDDVAQETASLYRSLVPEAGRPVAAGAGLAPAAVL
jgi:glycosyltransferase involved in cell wall biosynthesis